MNDEEPPNLSLPALVRHAAAVAEGESKLEPEEYVRLSRLADRLEREGER